MKLALPFVIAAAALALGTAQEPGKDRLYDAQADGSLARREYRSDAPGPFRAEITDVIVPPGKAITLAYEGIVVVDVRDGDGSARVQDKPVALTTGATIGLSQGQSARVENTGKKPLLLRVYVVTAQ